MFYPMPCALRDFQNGGWRKALYLTCVRARHCSLLSFGVILSCLEGFLIHMASCPLNVCVVLRPISRIPPVPLSPLHALPVVSSCLGFSPILSDLCLQSGSPPTSARVPLPCSTAQAVNEATVGLTLRVSCLSGVTVFHGPMSNILKTIFIYFVLFLLFQLEGKSSPCYTILSGSRIFLSLCFSQLCFHPPFLPWWKRNVTLESESGPWPPPPSCGASAQHVPVSSEPCKMRIMCVLTSQVSR